jgi:hypothetical protein
MSKFQLSIVLLLVAAFSFPIEGHPTPQQWRRGWGRRSRDPRNGVPVWKNDVEYKQDVFTFCRVRFQSLTRWTWDTDYPDSDLNFSYRLQQLTSLKVDPNGVIRDLTDPDIFNYPFIYMCEPGGLVLSEDERVALRKYLLNGGFLMADDFWGSRQWDSFEAAIMSAFPERRPVELPISHPIFSTVFELKEKPQVPNVRTGEFGRGMGPGGTHISWEDREPGSRDVHYKGLFDDNGRLMAIFCHNTDLGDGWEREGEYKFYFHEYSEKKAYPMGVNIVVYAMTH